jgi:hypothetical protein
VIEKDSVNGKVRAIEPEAYCESMCVFLLLSGKSRIVPPEALTETLVERRAIGVAPALNPVGRHRTPDHRRDIGQGVGLRPPEVALDDLLPSDRPTQLADGPHVDLDGEPLAVDKHPIAIEDDQPRLS